MAANRSFQDSDKNRAVSSLPVQESEESNMRQTAPFSRHHHSTLAMFRMLRPSIHNPLTQAQISSVSFAKRPSAYSEGGLS